jgi:hypothetical protein
MAAPGEAQRAKEEIKSAVGASFECFFAPKRHWDNCTTNCPASREATAGNFPSVSEGKLVEVAGVEIELSGSRNRFQNSQMRDY